MTVGSERPWVSVLTASYQQARFLADCIASVPTDGPTGVEHVVVDGGSTDGTVELLERESEGRRLRWVSEPDEGHADAVNKALSMARGEWVGIQNSDDYYLDGAFRGLRRAMERHPGHDAYYANLVRVDAAGRAIRRVYCSRPSWFVHRFRGLTVRHQALFLRREAMEALGGWDVGYRLALDYEFVGRLLRSDFSLRHVPSFWAAFREQEEAKTQLATGQEWREEIDAALGAPRYPGGTWTRPLARALLRAVAAAVQWAHIVADNGVGALADRLGEKAGRLRGPT